MIWRGSLFAKYATPLVVLVSGALVVSGLVEIYFSYQENKSALARIQHEKAAAAAIRIEQFVHELEHDLSWIAQTPWGPRGVPLAQRRLDSLRLLRQVPAITEVSHIDPTAHEQLRVSRLAMDVIGSKADFSQDPKFVQAMARKTYFSPVYFRKESEPYMTIAMAGAGEDAGVVAAEANLKFIWDVVSNLRIGKGGYAYVVDASGRLIAHPDISLVLQKTDLSMLPQIRAATSGPISSPGDAVEAIVGKDRGGHEVLSAYAPISTLKWFVLVDLPLAEAFAPIYASIWRTVVLLLVGVTISVIASLILVRRMVAPIHALRDGAARIGAGALDYRISVKTGDELEALADEFNRTTARLQESYANLERKVEERTRDLREALEQQTATAEILRVISSSPTDTQPVFATILASATRLCDASCGVVFRVTGDRLVVAAHHNLSSKDVAALDQAFPQPLNGGSFSGRAVLTRSVIHHVHGAEPDPTYPLALTDLQRQVGFRATLQVPMLKAGGAIGVLSLWRRTVTPFSEKQIALLQTFADQAVIAIENVRLFKELEERNKSLTESLEQQTATADILRVISSSPTDLQPVLDAVAKSAAQLCNAADSSIQQLDGDYFKSVASYGSRLKLAANEQFEVKPDLANGRAVIDRCVVHIPDLLEVDDATFGSAKRIAERLGYRTILVAPMLREGIAIGAIAVTRVAVGPFTDKQIELLKTFADQAVIAIENVRLFKELEERNKSLTEALEQQTATSEILRVISQSQRDVQPVFQAIVANAQRLTGGINGSLLTFDGAILQIGAIGSTNPETIEAIRETFPKSLEELGEGSVQTRAILTRATAYIPDVRKEPNYPLMALADKVGYRSIVSVPMLREGNPIGTIAVTGREPGMFSDRHITMLSVFADQAVIAIENVRLFKELEQRNEALTEALEQQTATAEILRVISKSPNDLTPVFDSILENAMRLCDAQLGNLFLYDGEAFNQVAVQGATPSVVEHFRRIARPGPATALGRLLAEKRPIHIPDITDDDAYRQRDPLRMATVELVKARSWLAVPLIKNETVVGAVVIYRQEVHPFSEAQISLVETFAAQAVIAIENVRLFKELQDRTQDLARSVGQLQALADVSQAVNSTLDLQEVLSAIVTRAVQLSSTDTGAVYEHDENSGELQLRATYGIAPELVDALLTKSLRVGEGATGKAAQERTPVEITDIKSTDAYSGPLRDVIERAEICSILAVPLLREDRVLGGLTVSRKIAGRFPPEVIEILQTFAAQSAIAIQNARLFREIEQKGHELEIASQHKSQFLANMSHELRTPLNAILGYTELIVDRIYGDVPEKILEVLERVQKSGRHLLGLINDVLDLSKIEAGQLTLSVSDYSFQDVVQSVVSSVESLASEKGLKLKVEIARKLPVGRADERRIVQVLMNLVGNAIKFTESGEVAIRVRAADNMFAVSVSDTGPGIPQDQHQKIFEEFQQVDGTATRTKGGTGLGLAIARKIIELHGGRIWVESTVGKGSTFSFSLPVKAERRETVQ